MKNLVIVESPAKAKTIENYLGKDYTVTASYGHVRDLPKKNNAIDIENDFLPQYEVIPDKKETIKTLKSLIKDKEIIYLATDEDREGEAISWHLAEVLGLDLKKTKRIVFNEITKTAILKAIENPRSINLGLVNAQQARRVLDRLVGFELSPLLWKKVKAGLSAGRVQSVAVRLLVEREREIFTFEPKSSFKASATFNLEGKKILKAELSKKLKHTEAKELLENCINTSFEIENLETKPSKKSPAAPFTTSTLQQEASRKLGFSVARTMMVAQKLYESGKITYMRTDSVNLSDTALNMAAGIIESEFGKKYYKRRKYKTKSSGAQEAHEAIRPTDMNNSEVSGSNEEKRLYDLIWKRTLASQMADAQLEKTTATIKIGNSDQKLLAKGEVLKFDGFLKVYIESTDDDETEQSGVLPPLEIGQVLDLKEMLAHEKFTRPSARYTQASLVKKLEELGIGRPSTYAPTISTIIKRKYVSQETRDGMQRKVNIIKLKNNKVTEKTEEETYGSEKNKLFPSDLAFLVTDFLVENFDNVVDYSFTAKVEKDFDEIASGKIVWNKMISDFYEKFHPKVEETVENAAHVSGERLLGVHPKTGKNVYARLGKYGPIVQLGDSEDEDKKFASLRGALRLETITLEEALELFSLPRIIGEFEDEEMKVSVGRFGPYVLHKGKFYSLGKDNDPYTIEAETAIEIIKTKREADAKKHIKSFEGSDVQILNGRYGPYIKINKKNVKIPKDVKPEELTLEQCEELYQKSLEKKPKKRTTKKKK